MKITKYISNGKKYQFINIQKNILVNNSNIVCHM